MRRRCLPSMLLLAAVACGGRAPVRVSVPPPAPVSGLTVTLEWEAPVDLDLYVTDPAWVTYYYAHRGAVMGRDARCLAVAPSAQWERAHFARPAPGRYRVGVDYPEACSGGADTSAYRIVIEGAGPRRTVAGTVRLRERKPLALEIDLP